MRTKATILLLIALGACTEYQPSEANCFSFVSRGATNLNCDFLPLEGEDLYELTDVQ